MKLFINDTSPFSRVVIAVAVLTETKSVNLEWTDPWQSPESLVNVNPFSTIPALVLDDGLAMTESLCICQYLMATSLAGASLKVDESNAADMARLGLAKTLMETSFRAVALSRFVDGENALSRRGIDGLIRALNQLESALAKDSSPFNQENLTTLYLHVAIDYIALRQPALLEGENRANIRAIRKSSVFNAVLDNVSLENLAMKPAFTDFHS